MRFTVWGAKLPTPHAQIRLRPPLNNINDAVFKTHNILCIASTHNKRVAKLGKPNKNLEKTHFFEKRSPFKGFFFMFDDVRLTISATILLA